MYITKEELSARLNKGNKGEVTIIQKVRKEREKRSEDSKGEDRLTHNDRVLIGVLEASDTQQNIAELMGVSQQTVNTAARGMTSPRLGIDTELKEDVEAGREKLAGEKLDRDKAIQDQLITNLAAALGHVSNNLHETDAVEASKIASDMSKILDRVSGSREERGGNRTAIIINVPSMKEEKHYQTITV